MTGWAPNVRASTDPIYLAIAKAIVADVAEGRLKPGDRLPTHRDLAHDLDISIGTVTRGYLEAVRRGVITGETGRGTFVRNPQSDQPVPYTRPTATPESIDLSANYPVYGQDPDLRAALAALAERDVAHLLRYRSAHIQPRYLKTAVAWMRTFGLEAAPESVVITAGAQHALAVILFELTKPGDLILADELTYPGLMALTQLRNLRLHGISTDEEGMIPEALRAACRQRNARAVYCMPTLHNPLSTIQSEERRRRLAEVAQEHDLLIIEDDMLRPLVPDAPPPLVNLAPERTFFIASTSKVIAGGLRVAYVVTPSFAHDRLKHGVWATTWMPTPLTVEIATAWIEDGTAARTTERRRAEIAARQQITREILGEYSYRGHPAAYSIWLELPAGWTSADFAIESSRRGVAITPSSSFVVPAVEPPNAVRVSLGGAESQSQLRAGLRVLAQMLHSSERCPSALV